MKKYYINYYRDFGNTFNLYCAETAADVAIIESGELGDCERITLKNALKKISQEKYARKFDPAFSGYGSVEILTVSSVLAMQNY